MNDMNSLIASRSLRSFFVCALLVLFSGPAALADKKDLPEVSRDGLQLTTHTKERIVYTKPGAALGKYSEVKILDCFVQFKKDWQRDYNLNELGLDGRVTDKDAERIKKGLAEEFRKEFTKVLNEKGHSVVNETGPDVLLLRPAIINLDVTAPDLMTPGIDNVVVSSAGSMTLYLELYDSATSELLVRVIDAKADSNMIAERSNRVTNTAAADRILRRWAEELAGHLGHAQGISSGSGN